MRLRIKVESKPDFGKLTTGMTATQRRSLAETAEYIRARSQQIAPLRTGALIASAQVRADEHCARVSYTAPYALIQHENTSLKHANGRRAKYLRTIIDDPSTLAYAESRLAAALRDCMKG